MHCSYSTVTLHAAPLFHYYNAFCTSLKSKPRLSVWGGCFSQLLFLLTEFSWKEILEIHSVGKPEVTTSTSDFAAL